MRYFYLAFFLICVTVLSLAGLRGSFSRRPPIELFSDMVRQPKVQPETPSGFFADGNSSRPHAPGTIAQAPPLLVNGKPVYPFEDSPVNTGRLTGATNWVETNPLPVTRPFLDRGEQQFELFCSVCHGPAGDGRGITAKYFMVAMANFHDKRLIDMTDGEIFDTITHGKNLMGAYGTSIPAQDRWAIIAYLRALQRSQLANLEDVPPKFRSLLQTNE